MATSKQVKRALLQGKSIATSTSNNRQRPVPEKDLQITDDSEEEPFQQTNGFQSGKQDKRSKLVRPNAFLSFRITNPQIIEHATDIQKQIIASNALLSKASVAIPTLHITLMVFALKTEEDKEKARQSLVDVCNQISLAKLSAPQITFTGLSHFNNKVLYMDPARDAQFDVLTRIADICRETFEGNGITSTDVRSFNPHLTLFKLSKARDLHRKGVRKIDQSWTSKYADQHFGIENVQTLHLCNMMKKQDDGYYEIFHEQHLFNDAPDVLHPSLSISQPDEISKLVQLDNVVISTVQTDEDIQQIFDEETVLPIPMITDESSPLLRADHRTYEEAFSGLASLFPRSCSQGCSCCSII